MYITSSNRIIRTRSTQNRSCQLKKKKTRQARQETQTHIFEITQTKQMSSDSDSDSKRLTVVNGRYRGGAETPVVGEAVSVDRGYALDGDAVLQRDSERKAETREQIKALVDAHALFTWGASQAYGEGALDVVRGEGIYLVDSAGRRYVDFNSGAMCANLGLSNSEVAAAVSEMVGTLPYAYPCTTMTPVKARLSALLADMMPGDLKHLYYVSGGAEANESAIRMARAATGRTKILTRYRSYHGATLGAVGLTGDQRRWPAEASSGAGFGIVRLVDPYPYTFDWGASGSAGHSKEEEEEAEAMLTKRNLAYIREVIEYEGPATIAGILIEAVTGTNGILVAPRGYLNGLRALCDHYGILMICDEVMSGFGRTGKLFGFMHSDPVIVPDIVTMAKGINGAYVPLGAVAVRAKIAAHFWKNPINIGSTYNSHPVALASAYAAIKWSLRTHLYDHVRAMERVMVEEMDKLAARHPCFKQARVVGLFGVFELQRNRRGDWLVPFNGGAHPAVAKFKAALRENGLITMMRWSQVYTNPPLVITEQQLRDSFAIIDKCLTIIDEVVED
jgi:taurine--2-oxoglutarate transaminase